MTSLSPHFKLREFTYSSTAESHGLVNDPPPHHIRNLHRLCTFIMEPIRELFGSPVVITSGYRSKELNDLVGGTASSAHLEGRAADFHIPGWTAIEVFKVVEKDIDIHYDQLIHEIRNGTEWLHVSIPKLNEQPRRQSLILEVK